MKTEQALAHSKEVLNQKRYEHVERVTETALRLADLHGENASKIGIAAALHDFSKDMDRDVLRSWIINSGDLPKDLLHYHHELWHGPVGSKVVERMFLLNDPEILDAIRYHTTGRIHMSTTDKIVFIADYIEPGRTFEAVHEARDLAQSDLDHACRYALKHSIDFLMNRKQPIYPDTFQAYNQLTQQIYK
ncbi:phosphohydrolase [Halalkalibacillus sediminis]|uniref:bis(5'-nucleosyl)-tetraphosphatase (symmetrical) n=1 Tax=Halalkalibacillus sediminis TaxID=2018042 RepID=A0A2I0QXL9_9BACI|nr:bis(5'-nucleosyl)-tetraphosphatase (symmetrical) YqeK [Halalkalibacillus sediminis]PKR79058.1 phosphohydrolase [Halalkalibacillus sediminis]